MKKRHEIRDYRDICTKDGILKIDLGKRKTDEMMSGVRIYSVDKPVPFKHHTSSPGRPQSQTKEAKRKRVLVKDRPDYKEYIKKRNADAQRRRMGITLTVDEIEKAFPDGISHNREIMDRFGDEHKLTWQSAVAYLTNYNKRRRKKRDLLLKEMSIAAIKGKIL